MSTINAAVYLQSGEAPLDSKLGGVTDGNNIIIADNLSNISLQPAYFSAKATPNLILTNTYQTVEGWVNFIQPQGFSEDLGVFTVSSAGIYSFNLERGYNNPDRAPTAPIVLHIGVWKNGILAFERDGIIGAATAVDEPTYLSITSPSILALEAGDTLEIKVKAEEGTGISPLGGCELTVMQLASVKIYELPA